MSGLLTLRGCPRPVIEDLLDNAERFGKQIEGRDKASTELAGVTVTTAFFEPSTRTRLSFEKAAFHLGAHVMTFSPESSSLDKGESLRDTALTLGALGSDVLVVRHGKVGVPGLVARWTGLPVVNAGDGRGEHPTQALADLLTMRKHFGAVDDLRVGIVGDIANSRVARSHLWALPAFGVDLTLVAPRTLLPTSNPWGVRMETDLDAVIAKLDVVYLLRVQRERGAAAGFPNLSGYAARFGLTEARLALLQPAAVIMHPGPINRGVEICAAGAESSRSLILDQVANGVSIRMSVLASLMGAG
ncbi:MAG TPA: aspartate carbamoyltransferase catalytic subunit [Acidimicrobiia bacterium]|nr:aspartate carbamoyltransferase catalytic subunit [Acidimicrobiia bacterium]